MEAAQEVRGQTAHVPQVVKRTASGQTTIYTVKWSNLSIRAPGLGSQNPSRRRAGGRSAAPGGGPVDREGGAAVAKTRRFEAAIRVDPSRRARPALSHFDRFDAVTRP